MSGPDVPEPKPDARERDDAGEADAEREVVSAGDSTVASGHGHENENENERERELELEDEDERERERELELEDEDERGRDYERPAAVGAGLGMEVALDADTPEGASCSEHPDRQAYFTCPRCGSYACAFCWHPSVKRCHGCIKRDPTEAAEPIPWEAAGEASLWSRYVGTLATAFRPMRSAPAFARPGLGAAWTFMLLSALPLTLLAGVIPHTRTLLFTGYLQVQLIGQPDTLEVVLDVLRAMGVQLALGLVELACLYLPYTSLVRAYAPERHHAAARVVLYRLWLLPGTLALLYIGMWALAPPLETPEIGLAGAVLLTIRMIVPVLLIVAMGGVARLACGLGPFMSMLVVIVPMILLLVVEPLASMTLLELLPPSPER